MIDPKYKKSDQILEVYSEFGNIGIWFFDRQTGYEEVSEEWAAMLGYKADDLNPMTKEKFLNLIHPEDCQRSKEKIETLYSGGYISYENEFRLKHQDGHYVWVLSQAKVFSWENDKPKMIIGTHINIENQKKQLEKINAKPKTVENTAKCLADLEMGQYGGGTASDQEVEKWMGKLKEITQSLEKELR